MDNVSNANRALKEMEKEAESSLKNNRTHKNEEKTGPAIIQLVLFWGFVLVPLIWGVVQTFGKAMQLFE